MPKLLLRVATLSMALALADCRAGTNARHWRSCRCDYVTDFDQPGRFEVEVCSEETDPGTAAMTCARNAGVGAVTACRCESVPIEACGAAFLCRTTR